MLENLARDNAQAAKLSVLYQMRFIGQEGLGPVVERCTCCHKDIYAMSQQHFCIDLRKGGIVCGQCPTNSADRLLVSKGTLKQLQWLSEGTLPRAWRAKFMPSALGEATRFFGSVCSVSYRTETQKPYFSAAGSSTAGCPGDVSGKVRMRHPPSVNLEDKQHERFIA